MLSFDLPPPCSGSAEAITVGSDAFKVKLLKLVSLLLTWSDFIKSSTEYLIFAFGVPYFKLKKFQRY